MLLDCDEQLFMAYKQRSKKGAENILATWLEAESNLREDPKILGTSLSPNLFLVNEETAKNIAFPQHVNIGVMYQQKCKYILTNMV